MITEKKQVVARGERDGFGGGYEMVREIKRGKLPVTN